MPDLPVRKRHHLSPDKYVGMGAYFLTICAVGRRPIFNDPALAEKLLDVLRGCCLHRLFDLIAYCFMPDHLHLLIRGRSEGSDMRAFVALFKKQSGYRCKPVGGGKLCQEDYYDHVLRAADDIAAIAAYIWMNPVRKGFCESFGQWPFSGSFTLDWPRVHIPAEGWIPPWEEANRKAHGFLQGE